MQLITYPHPGLLRKTAPLAPPAAPMTGAFAAGSELEQRIDAMIRIMHESDGVGLAAPQVDWSVRLLVMNAGRRQPGGSAGGDAGCGDEVLINPVIRRRRGRALGEEGCLSFPGIYVEVERAQEIDVEYLDRTGRFRQETRTDFAARVIQHELDHLDNILLIHRMTPADRVRVKRELEVLTRKG